MKSTTANSIANWFLTRNQLDRNEYIDVEGITNFKLQKLLYYAYGCYLALYNQKLFTDNIVAWAHGPAIESIYAKYKNSNSDGIQDFEPSTETFTNEELEVLEWIYKEFGQYTAWALRKMSQAETPWKETPQGEIIKDGLIKAYFWENYIEMDKTK